MKRLFCSLQIAALIAGILLFAGSASAQTANAPTPGPNAMKVAAKLPAGKTLATAGAGELRKATSAAAAEDGDNAANMAVEVLQYLAKLTPEGNMLPLVIAVVRGAFEGAPEFASDIAESVINAFPQYREAIQRLLRRSGNDYEGAGPGPGFGGGPGGVGGRPSDDDEDPVTPDAP